MSSLKPSPARALPRAFRRPRILIIGAGDVGMRLAALLRDRCRVIAMVRRPERRDEIAADAGGGARGRPPRDSRLAVVIGDLDRPASLARAASLAERVVHLAPPPPTGEDDPRTRALIVALARRRALAASLTRAGQHPATGAAHSGATAIWPGLRRPAGMVARGFGPGRRFPYALAYVSTTGVYGDRAGNWVDERTPAAAATGRARRRVAAEARLREATRRATLRAFILRAPGIYALDRLPVERLERGTPALRPEDDVYTNHVHAEDLARSAWYALLRGRAGRVYNVVDRSELRMGEYFDLVAERLGLPRPPRIPRDQLASAVSPMTLSFMSESRRVRAERLSRELRMRLRYPSVASVFEPS